MKIACRALLAFFLIRCREIKHTLRNYSFATPCIFARATYKYGRNFGGLMDIHHEVDSRVKWGMTAEVIFEALEK